ncbi:MAG: RuvX/YqgF family protein [Patescibacteria group bacterium]
MRYLGVDYGSKKVGLALSDEQGTMGFPYAVVANTPRLVDELCACIVKENVGAVVIGESRNLAGDENPIAKGARALGDSVARISQKPIFYESEAFTSAEARRLPDDRQARPSRAPKAHADVDASAAALIRSSYLSRSDHG